MCSSHTSLLLQPLPTAAPSAGPLPLSQPNCSDLASAATSPWKLPPVTAEASNPEGDISPCPLGSLPRSRLWPALALLLDPSPGFRDSHFWASSLLAHCRCALAAPWLFVSPSSGAGRPASSLLCALSIHDCSPLFPGFEALLFFHESLELAFP